MKSPRWFLLFIILQIIMFLILLSAIVVDQHRSQRIEFFQGEKGEQGESITGQDGLTPKKGVDYFDGQKGDKGDTGSQGEKGEKGEKGETGEKGEQGLKGDTGEQGVQGEAGQAGRSIEIRCRDFKTRPSEVQTRLEGSDLWQTLYEIPHKCEVNGG